MRTTFNRTKNDPPRRSAKDAALVNIMSQTPAIAKIAANQQAKTPAKKTPAKTHAKKTPSKSFVGATLKVATPKLTKRAHNTVKPSAPAPTKRTTFNSTKNEPPRRSPSEAALACIMSRTPAIAKISANQQAKPPAEKTPAKPTTTATPSMEVSEKTTTKHVATLAKTPAPAKTPSPAKTPPKSKIVKAKVTIAKGTLAKATPGRSKKVTPSLTKSPKTPKCVSTKSNATPTTSAAEKNYSFKTPEPTTKHHPPPAPSSLAGTAVPTSSSSNISNSTVQEIKKEWDVVFASTVHVMVSKSSMKTPNILRWTVDGRGFVIGDEVSS